MDEMTFHVVDKGGEVENFKGILTTMMSRFMSLVAIETISFIHFINMEDLLST